MKQSSCATHSVRAPLLTIVLGSVTLLVAHISRLALVVPLEVGSQARRGECAFWGLRISL